MTKIEKNLIARLVPQVNCVNAFHGSSQSGSNRKQFPGLLKKEQDSFGPDSAKTPKKLQGASA